MGTSHVGYGLQLPRVERPSTEPWRRALLACGVAYAALYVVANDGIGAALVPGYSRLTQAISELSAVGSPAKPFLSATLPVFAVLLAAFGVGVWRSAGGTRALRITGALLVAQAATSVLWLLAPMSQRDVIAAGSGTVADVLHLVMSGLSMAYVTAQLVSSAVGLGRAFRAYVAVSFVVLVAAMTATGVLSTRLAEGQSTPLLGLLERAGLGAWLLWMAVLAGALWRSRVARTTSS